MADLAQHPSRSAILEHPDALDCTLYRPDERDPEAEETDLGDARILFRGVFEPPADWDALERDEFYGDADPASFFTAYIEPEAAPGSKQAFVTQVGDFVATIPGVQVIMYFVVDYIDDAGSRIYVLQRDDQPLD